MGLRKNNKDFYGIVMIQNFRKEQIKMSIEAKVEVELDDRLDELAKMKGGSEEYKVTVEGITKVLDRKLEIDKQLLESDRLAKQQEFDNSMKAKQMKDERVDRIVKHGLTALSIASSIGLTAWGTCKTLKFEETGTVTTSAGRNFIKNLFSKK